MKTIALMGISCLLLAGVYGVMNKASAASNILSFNQAQGATSPIDTGDKDKNNGSTTEPTDHTTSISKTLDDSHWIDDPLIEKAAGSGLITDNEVDVPHAKSDPENIRQAGPHQEAVPEVKQLILELEADSTAPQKVPVESI
jgi:hypothetical protein